jgi:hypothetical protein
MGEISASGGASAAASSSSVPRVYERVKGVDHPAADVLRLEQIYLAGSHKPDHQLLKAHFVREGQRSGVEWALVVLLVRSIRCCRCCCHHCCGLLVLCCWCSAAGALLLAVIAGSLRWDGGGEISLAAPRHPIPHCHSASTSRSHPPRRH